MEKWQRKYGNMARTLGIGKQDFEKVRKENAFYIDKTKFIRQWWESEDDVTLITRPRRFGKTLNMSMLERFFSVRFAGQGDLFRGLAIWEDEKYRRLQGTYPVLFNRQKRKFVVLLKHYIINMIFCYKMIC